MNGAQRGAFDFLEYSGESCWKVLWTSLIILEEADHLLVPSPFWKQEKARTTLENWLTLTDSLSRKQARLDLRKENVQSTLATQIQVGCSLNDSSPMFQNLDFESLELVGKMFEICVPAVFSSSLNSDVYALKVWLNLLVRAIKLSDSYATTKTGSKPRNHMHQEQRRVRGLPQREVQEDMEMRGKGDVHGEEKKMSMSDQ
ncbi:hypothetical protein VNO77_16022 [Canavalia gladiata]|uniref:Uncharacterized protein n=1 Tax=Canavalia gladiata TaxID=3824 RepID=A0AAN9M4T3_CANGL